MTRITHILCQQKRAKGWYLLRTLRLLYLSVFTVSFLAISSEASAQSANHCLRLHWDKERLIWTNRCRVGVGIRFNTRGSHYFDSQCRSRPGKEFPCNIGVPPYGGNNTNSWLLGYGVRVKYISCLRTGPRQRSDGSYYCPTW